MSGCGGRSRPRKTTKKAFRHTSRNGPPYFVVNRPRSCRPHQLKDWKDIAGKHVCAKQGVAYNKLVETRT